MSKPMAYRKSSETQDKRKTRKTTMSDRKTRLTLAIFLFIEYSWLTCL